MRVFPGAPSSARKQILITLDHAEARETSTSSMRTSCGSFVHEAGSVLQHPIVMSVFSLSV